MPAVPSGALQGGAEFCDRANDVIEAARGRALLHELAVDLQAVVPQTRNVGSEVATQTLRRLCRHRPVARLARRYGHQRGRLQSLGLRPQARLSVVNAEIVKQRIDRDAVAYAVRLADLHQSHGGLSSPGAAGPAPPQQQPRPLELMARFHDPARGARQRRPVLLKVFAYSP